MDNIDLTHLTEAERQHIIDVLRRDIELKQKHEQNLQKLKREISEGTAVADLRTPPSSTRVCERCCAELGVLFGKSKTCAKCSRKICADCSVPIEKGLCMCTVCHKEWEYTCASGQWFFKELAQQTPKLSVAEDHRRISDEYRPRAKTSLSTTAVSEILLTEIQKPSLSIHSEVDAYGTLPDFSTTDRMSLGKRRRSKGWIQASNFMIAMQAMKPRPSMRKPCSSGRTWDAPTSSSDNEGIESFDNFTKPVSPKISFTKSFANDAHVDKRRSAKLSLSLREPSNRSDHSSSEVDNNEGETTGFRRHKFSTMRLPLRNTTKEKLCGADASSNEKAPTLAQPLQNFEAVVSKPCDTFIRPNSSAAELLSHAAVSSNRTDLLSSLVASSKASSLLDLTYEDRAELQGRHHDVARTPSFVSLCSGLYQEQEYLSNVSGEIKCRISYDIHQAALEICIIECQNLAAVARSALNLYVKTYLLPATTAQAKRKTRVKRNCSNPVFNQVIKYEGLTRSEIELKQLLISVWHSDLIGKNIHIGEACVALCDYPWTSQEPVLYALHPRDLALDLPNSISMNLKDVHEARLLLSLKFSPNPVRNCLLTVGTLYCFVRSCQSLVALKPGGCLNTFVKGYLYPPASKNPVKQKTSIIKRSNEPVWNHTFTFEGVPLESLKNKTLVLLVLAKETFGSSMCLGGVRLNCGSGVCEDKAVDWMDADEQEAKLWKSVIDRQNAWIEASLRIRSDVKSRVR